MALVILSLCTLLCLPRTNPPLQILDTMKIKPGEEVDRREIKHGESPEDPLCLSAVIRAQ
jgi:hypothetical protein